MTIAYISPQYSTVQQTNLFPFISHKFIEITIILNYVLFYLLNHS